MRIRNHIRTNVVGYIAIFMFAIGGTAYATHPGGANTISSGDIINGEVKTADIGGGAVTAPDIGTAAVVGSRLAKNSVNSQKAVDDSLTGVDIGDSTLSGIDIADGSLISSDVASNALTGDDVQESSLGQVPSALLGGFGRTGAEASCDPESTTFITCAATEVINVPAGARALILARVRATNEGTADSAIGECRLGTSSTGVVANTTSTMATFDDRHLRESETLVGVSPPLPAGATSFGIDCNQLPNFGAIQYDEVSATVLLISGS